MRDALVQLLSWNLHFIKARERVTVEIQCERPELDLVMLEVIESAFGKCKEKKQNLSEYGRTFDTSY